MAIIHHRFETIHPFYDGNGRTGRIINILYLIKEDFLSLPILYLSRYIIQYKADYYHLLQQVRMNGDWEPWILFVLKGVERNSDADLHLIEGISELMQNIKTELFLTNKKSHQFQYLTSLLFVPIWRIVGLWKLGVRRSGVRVVSDP